MNGWMKVGRRWVEVPHWARWMAQDSGGDWCFYKYRPSPGHYEHIQEWFTLYAHSALSTPVIGDWREQLYELIWS